jgi:preprotein translocase SecE subunit
MKNERQEDNKMSTTHKTNLFAETNDVNHQALKTKGQESFIQNLKSELGKVSWTAKQELINSTKVVVGSTFLFAIGIYVVDVLVRQCVESVHLLARVVFGA